MRDMQIYTVALVTGFAIQFFPIAARSISSQFAGIGSLSIFNYAFKLIELPIALMLTVFSTVFLPKLVLASNLGKSKMNELLSRIWTMVNFIFPLSFSTSAFFFILSHSGTLFNYELNVEMINVLKLTAIGLLAFAFRCYNETFIVALSAKTIVNDQFKSASLAGIMGLILALAMTYKFGLDGTFWATNIYYTLLAGFNYYFLRKNNIGEKMSHVFAWRNFKLFSTCTALVLLVLFERTFGYTNFVLSVILGFVIVSSILILVKIKEIGKYCSENL